MKLSGKSWSKFVLTEIKSPNQSVFITDCQSRGPGPDKNPEHGKMKFEQPIIWGLKCALLIPIIVSCVFILEGDGGGVCLFCQACCGAGSMDGNERNARPNNNQL